MVTIKLSTFTTEAASKAKGTILKTMLVEALGTGEKIVVDFSGIKRFASPFFNNSFATLGLIYGFDLLDKIERINITSTGDNTYETSVENAKLIYQNPEFSSEIDEIINNVPKKVEY